MGKEQAFVDGLQIELAPDDLLKACKGEYGDIT